MTYEQIVSAWNAQADEYNQYDTLSDRERLEWALSLVGKAKKQEPVDRQTRIEMISGAIARHLGGMLSPKAVIAAATYIADHYTAPQPCPECAERPSASDYVEQRDIAIAKTAECEKLKHELHCLDIEFGDVRDSYDHYKAECEKLKAEVVLTKKLAQQSNQDHLNARKNYQGEIIKLKAERDELTEELRLSKLNAGNWHKQFMAAMTERDELAAQNQQMREALTIAATTPHIGQDAFTLKVQDAAVKALALPDLSTGILNRVRAEALRKAADICNIHATMATNQDGAEWANSCETAISALAADMEAGK